VLQGVGRGAGIALRAGFAPAVMGARLAWRRIGLDDPQLPETRWDWSNGAKILLDEIFFASEIALAEVLPARERARATAELRDADAWLEESGHLDDPRGYHADPPPIERARFERQWVAGFSFQHMRFESGFEPHPDEPGRARWLSYEPNRTAHAWVMRHRGPERPWALCIPGYRMGSPLVDFTGFRARWLYRELGLNVAIPVLPLHGPRSIGRRNGDGFFTGDFLSTLHAQTQAVWDVRRLVGWLRQRGAASVVAHGVSLGGYTAALVASVEEHLDGVVAGIPAIDVPRLLKSHVPGALRFAVDRLGFPAATVERVLHPVSPLALQPRVPAERRFLYAGLVDRLTPPDHARDLWLHWGRPRAHFYQGGHVSFLFEPGVKRLLRDAFRPAGPRPRGSEGSG
jgi:hypothetical protein